MTPAPVPDRTEVVSKTPSTPPLDGAAYEEFVGELVERYAAMGVHTYAVENEPDVFNFWAGEVADYDDLPEDRESLTPAARRVRALFDRVGRAARTLSDDHDPLPSLPDEPDILSFGIAGLIDMDAGRRHELLISRLASGRLATML